MESEGVAFAGADQVDATLLTEPSEMDLIRMLAAFPQEIVMAAEKYDPSRINRFVIDLASAFHRFYGRRRPRRPAGPPGPLHRRQERHLQCADHVQDQRSGEDVTGSFPAQEKTRSSDTSSGGRVFVCPLILEVELHFTDLLFPQQDRRRDEVDQHRQQHRGIVAAHALGHALGAVEPADEHGDDVHAAM